MKGSTIFGSVSINLASSDLIGNLSYGEVKKPETINYRTLRPEKEGLFCEKIFGPTKDYECSCGKFRSIRYKGIICDKCGVEVTESKVRRYRTGHIDLAAPVAHIWYYRIVPSKIALLLQVAPSDIQSILYFEKYIVIDPGETDLIPNQVLTDEEFDEYIDKYKEAFTADTGAGAIERILKEMDLDDLSDELRDFIAHKHKKVDKKVLKRLELVEELRKSNNKTEWVILNVIPVIPPDLRPMVPLDGGRFATSDINDLYRRLINRNNRLKKLKEVSAPEIIIKNEMRMVQDAVDSLFDNSRRSHPVTGNGDRPLKSLSDILKGKQGRFRQNLLGKRVDYSGRSVIIVGPNLRLHQCGLPKQMALELFKPFVMKGLVENAYAHNIKAAKRMIEIEHELVWGILEEVVQSHPVLLNRAPTLHRLGIQAFEPILVEEKAIQLHPLVCHAYNADFDGDQMAVHVPLTPEAQIEAWLLMLSSRNLLNPANGKPVVYPTQDMVLGLYYLTKPYLEKPAKLKAYDNVDELIFAVTHNAITYNTHIRYKKNDEWYETCVGRVIFNEVVPKKLGFINDTMSSKRVQDLIAKSYNECGIRDTAFFVDDLKALGYKYATIFGVSIAISDVEIPDDKQEIVEKTEKKVKQMEENARRGLITKDEKHNQVVDLWAAANEKIKKKVVEKLEKSQDGFNSLYVMMDSGARGSKEQFRQLAGMRGLMAKPSGEMINLAIKSNFKEGLTVFEYFISSHGARKGLADTALKTADAGYLTRKLVDVSQDVVVTMEDCGTVKGIEIEAVKEAGKIIKTLGNRILGRVNVSNIYDPKIGDLLIAKNTVLNEEEVQKIENAGVEKVKIRSVLSCEAKQGICARCYGWDLSVRKLVNIGEAAGIIAAESIGQPGTQLTMRSFHTGGVGITDVEEANIMYNGDKEVLINISAAKFIVCANGDVVISRKSKLLLKSSDNIIDEVVVEPGTKILMQDGDTIKKGDIIAQRDPYNSYFISENDANVGYKLEVHTDGRREIFKNTVIVFDNEGVELQRFILPPRTSVFEGDGIVGVEMFKDTEDMEIMSVNNVKETLVKVGTIKVGGVVGKIAKAKKKTQDLVGGLPTVVALFEARRSKNPTVMCKVDGVVDSIDPRKGKYLITVKAMNGRLFPHIVKTGKNLYVQSGTEVKAGEPLCEGEITAHQILKVLGYTSVEEYMLNRIQSVYRMQGIEINEKHISVIIRQMLKKVEILDPGDTEFIAGQNVDKLIFDAENENVENQGGQSAKATPVIMGLTKAALLTESFFSAASFQETPKVLSSAALRGAVDNLQGLKENLVIGQLIPAGTGIKNYSSIRLKMGEG